MYDLVEVYEIVKRLCAVDFSKLFSYHASAYQTRGHQFKLQKQQFKQDFRKLFFSNRIIEAWNNLPSDIVEANSILSFKCRLSKHMQCS